MIRVFKTGTHAHRTPLSYDALAPLFEDSLQMVSAPGEADIYVFAHVLDIEAAPEAMVQAWRRRARPIVLLSEEPFWDTLWGRQPLARTRWVDSRWGRLPVTQLTHQTSQIFHFQRIPYYLLTNHRFANAYATRFARNARLSARDWQQSFLRRRSDITFMFERRDGAHHAVQWPEGDLAGLCQWRTHVAEQCRAGVIDRLGQSWQGHVPRRGDLEDWHLDKLNQLDHRARIIGAFENTHQPTYITEKIFDAFACGAVPAYHASPGHRIHAFNLPARSWINLHALSAQAAAERLDAVDWTDTDRVMETCQAYAQAQDQLARLFSQPHHWLAERQRLKRALLAEFTQLLDSAAAAGAQPA